MKFSHLLLTFTSENIRIKCERGFTPFSHYFFTESEVRKCARYLTHDDRLLIEKLYAHGITPSSIAGVVGVSLATIYRELPRGYTGKRYPGGRKVYSAEKAQQTTNQNIKRRGRTPADRKDATK